MLGTLMMEIDLHAFDGFELFWDPAFPISADEADKQMAEPDDAFSLEYMLDDMSDD